ncbi:hypothetical protein ACP8HZ_00075 [Francisella noatunensis]
MDAQKYIDSVIAKVERDGHEKEFISSCKEVFSTLKPALEKNPKFIEENILERIVEPERGIHIDSSMDSTEMAMFRLIEVTDINLMVQ